VAKLSLRDWQGRFGRLSFWWVTGLGSGLLRPAPGTWGSLFGLIAGVGILTFDWSYLYLILGALLLTVVSNRVIDAIEQETGVHDAPEIVIDEVAGQWIAMVPLAYYGVTALKLFAAFALFRLFDIIKPWPIGPLDKQVSGGFGVMVDDLVAGVFAAVVYLALEYFALL
jgi:phosphatidylglycerophosphatase A